MDEHAAEGDDAVRRALAAVPEEHWRVLERLVDELSAAGVSTEWVRPEPRVEVRDGVEQTIHQFPYPQYAPQVIAAEAALYDMGLIVNYDWPAWSESRRYFDGEPVEDEVIVVKFLTAVVRAERFSEGTLARAAESGVFAGALRVLCGGRRPVTRSNRFRGCLLGAAVGDALGAPVEFTSLSRILDQFGPDGITDYSPAFGRIGAITDDTQMTLFTAEGLLCARDRPDADPMVEINRAYLRWLTTQDGSVAEADRDAAGDSWLLAEEFLHSRRAPGNTCLSALRAGGMGTTGQPINDSKGCGGVMRVAPIGLLGHDPFRLAADAAALTHGHPSGFLAAGALAELISALVAGRTLPDAVAHARARTATEPDSGEVVDTIDEAVALAGLGPATIGSVEALGQGWVAEEALGMSIYCALVAGDFENGVVLAVNHGGDSDSTGAITGNILGALLGEESIPTRWLDPLEGHDTIAGMADLLVNAPDG